MKRTAILGAILLVVAACSTRPSDELLTSWTLQQEGSQKIYSVTVPCTVAGALSAAGEFGENPLEGLRFFDLDKGQFDSTWVFSTEFAGKEGHQVLRMGGIGYSADILVNGTLIASADTTLGVFTVREWDITPLVQKSNRLEVRTHKSPWGSLNHGFVDWNPHALDEFMGILAPVSIIHTPDVEVQDVFVKPVLSEDLATASIVVTTTLVNRSDKAVTGTLRGVYNGGLFQKGVNLEAGDKIVCDTSRGTDQMGVCCCDSFMADPEIVCPLFGTQPKNLRYVTGIVDYRKFEYAMEEEEEENDRDA